MNPSTSMYLTVSCYSNLEHFEETLLCCTPPVRGSKTLRSGEVLRYVTHKTTSIPKRKHLPQKSGSPWVDGLNIICKLGGVEETSTNFWGHHTSIVLSWLVRLTSSLVRVTAQTLHHRARSVLRIYNYIIFIAISAMCLKPFTYFHYINNLQIKQRMKPPKKASSNVTFNFPSPPAGCCRLHWVGEERPRPPYLVACGGDHFQRLNMSGHSNSQNLMDKPY